jgi:hypothetical protein
MLRRFENADWIQGAIRVFVSWLLFCLPSYGEEPQPQVALIKSRIEAGEFAPALELARQVATVELRDTYLAQIAMGQAQAGIREASFCTAGEISDDRTRSEVLSGAAAEPLGGQGGGTQADFQSLIDLITTTVRPTSWDSVGGPGSISSFPTGVYVNPQGVLQPLLKEESAGLLAALHASSAPKSHRENARKSSPLRKISLQRLEKQVQLRLARGEQPSDTMQVLAGLQRIKYVFVYPESGDIVLAGPAGNWKAGDENIIVSTDSDQPVVRFDDLVVIFRHMTSVPNASFGCLIVPRQESLARFQEFLKQSNKRPLQPGERKTWLKSLQSQLGEQDIEVYGLDPRTRAARIMVEADYRMKLVGMGLEDGVPGVQSYLAMIKIPPGQSPPPMAVLRWWFTLNYDAIIAAKDHCAFAINGQGVKTLSENERLSAEGKRIHTGESDALTRQFAQSFTENFEALSIKYPIYGELRNIFDLALVGSLIREEKLAAKTGWHMTCFADPNAYQVELGPAPKTVQSVVNFRNINGIIVAGVSGGVVVAPAGLVAPQAVRTESDGVLNNQRIDAVPKQASGGGDIWWWD